LYGSQLIEKIEAQACRIGIIGLGNEGLLLALLFAQAKFKVGAYDERQTLIDDLRGGVSPIAGLPSAHLVKLLSAGMLQPTAQFEALCDADAYIICLPAPSKKGRTFDLSYIEQTVEALLDIWKPGKLAIIESIAYPGSTNELFLQPFLRRGLLPDRDFFMALSPERSEAVEKNYGLSQIPKLLSGITPRSETAATALYNMVFDQIIPVSSVRVAELTKLLENSFRSVNTALINEFDEVCQQLGVNTSEVIAAAKTKPFGFMAFSPGGTVESNIAAEFQCANKEQRLVALAHEINQERPRQLVYRIMEKLSWLGKPLLWANILVLGVANQPIMSEAADSPTVALIEQLMLRGALVTYSDPAIRQITLQDERVLQHNPLSKLLLSEADLVVIAAPNVTCNATLLAEFEDKILDVNGSYEALPEVIKLHKRENESTLKYQPTNPVGSKKRNVS